MTGELLHCHWRDLAEHVRRTVGQVDALIVDAPYSERTHKGHSDGTEAANTAAARVANGGASATFERRESKMARRDINYAAWSASDVDAFVSEWAPLTSGWFVSITDHVLAPAWEASLARSGRYVFAPLACVTPGGRFRATGDGPAQWSCYAVVARPKSGPWLKRWRSSRGRRGADNSLPGAYVTGVERMPVVGGKASALMSALVDDYSEPGDLVCDPCMGAGTTLLAAKLLGRQYIGGDLDAKHVEIARERLRDLPAQPKSGTLALPWKKP